MKRIIITTLTLVAIGALIGWVLISNKKENEAKAAIVSQTESAIPVTIATVSKKPIKLDFSANGKFSSNQDLQILSEANGRVLQLRVKRGSKVNKGQVLAVIESEMAGIEAQKAEDNYQKTKIDYDRYKSAYETGGVTKAQFDDVSLAMRNAESQLRQAKRNLNDATVKAPITGVINDRFIEEGSFVSVGTPLFEIVDASFLKLNVSANEYQVVNIQEGDEVAIFSNVFPDEEFKGTIDFIAQKADNTMNYPIEILVENSNKIPLKSGMYATAKFEFPEQEPRIIVDRTAFVGSVSSNQVYVYSESNQTVSLREVVAGRIIGEQVEVLRGLEEGEKVITSGQINLRDGSEVEAMNL